MHAVIAFWHVPEYCHWLYKRKNELRDKEKGIPERVVIWLEKYLGEAYNLEFALVLVFLFNIAWE